jgi:undecaprenyl diphosphate synthase
MDGNGRWAEAQGLPRSHGHAAGAKTVRMVVEESRKLGISVLTLFAFSAENWCRPQDEVSSLMLLFLRYLQSEVQLFLDNDIRLRSIGNLTRIPGMVRKVLEEVEEKTARCQAMDLVLAVSYSGRDEIVDATRELAKKVAAGELVPEKISARDLVANLYLADLPDPDLLIRTSNEFRLSNFLLWQLAYSEIVVAKALWPEFSKDDFYECLAIYRQRERRFGLTKSQVFSGVN